MSVEDSAAGTAQALATAAQNHDVLISFGGVSVGEEDHIKNAVATLGEVNHWKIKIKPGKPLLVGTIKQGATATPILGLPGNPVSAFVTFLLFGKPLLAALTGSKPTACYSSSSALPAPIGFTISKARKRPEYVRVHWVDGRLQLCGNQSSGVLSSLNNCDGLALIPEDTTLNAGDGVSYFPLDVLVNS